MKKTSEDSKTGQSIDKGKHDDREPRRDQRYSGFTAAQGKTLRFNLISSWSTAFTAAFCNSS